MPFAAILAAISGVAGLFDAGKALYEKVTGQPTTAATPDALIEEVKKLTPEQQQAWTEGMDAKTKQYEAESARIAQDQGDVTPDILKVLDPKAAASVAIERMTTRPRIVKDAMKVVMLPIFITVCDMAFMFFNAIYRMVTNQREIAPFDLFSEKIFDPTSVYYAMYQWAAGICATIVISYITAKTTEAVKNGSAAADGVSSSISSVLAGISAVKGAIKGK